MLKHKIIKILPFVLLSIVLAAFAVGAMFTYNNTEEETKTVFLTVWQIDGFEGGKGSRKSFIQKSAEKFFEGQKIYVNVQNLTKDSANENILHGTMPDIISYSPSFCGKEGLINDCDFAYKCWCNGAYFILSLDLDCDFTDVSEENIIVNSGKDNNVEVLKVLLALGNAKCVESTEAYLKLLDGSYKYLLGTQRDIFRLKVSGVDYAYKVVDGFNDLYQLVSVFTSDKEKYSSCVDFVNYLCNSDVSSLGLYSQGVASAPDGLPNLSKINFSYCLKAPTSESYMQQIASACKNKDLKNLKSLLQ